jgi:hypothetical protein
MYRQINKDLIDKDSVDMLIHILSQCNLCKFQNLNNKISKKIITRDSLKGQTHMNGCKYIVVAFDDIGTHVPPLLHGDGLAKHGKIGNGTSHNVPVYPGPHKHKTFDVPFNIHVPFKHGFGIHGFTEFGL